ncbi:hypothetical protein MCUN1_000191 [Malassezia cuniculi]|uniref:Uncharacterized protein n=1 Tax=Malassezia cuniculi TaxID=948313 RepID=A0AAF0EMK5_9BASI|nr:hypothetical protein MCUN1_000191 [Malassezia cuniculi]
MVAQTSAPVNVTTATMSATNRMVRSSRPTASLARRTVPLSTMSPVSLFVPTLAGDKANDDKISTRIYYLGMGYRTETSVYAIVTGAPGSDGTAYMFQAATQVYIPNLQRTVTLENGTTISGKFNIGCKYEDGVGGSGTCTMMYEPGPKTTVNYVTTQIQVRPFTTFTPVRGQLQAEMAKTATTPSGVSISAQRSGTRSTWPHVYSAWFAFAACVMGIGALLL